jgi:hypothetical protein
MIIDILDYNSTNKYKTTRALTAADANGSGTTMFNSSLWQSTSAITRIDLSTASSWKIYTQFALYGIRSA